MQIIGEKKHIWNPHTDNFIEIIYDTEQALILSLKKKHCLGEDWQDKES